jgi:hypothetical protein
MVWIKVATAMSIVLGVVGYVRGLRNSRRNDEAERGLVAWMVLAWVGIALLVVSEVS